MLKTWAIAGAIWYLSVMLALSEGEPVLWLGLVVWAVWRRP